MGKPNKRVCETPWCRGTPAKYRKLCSKCRSRQYAREHPFRYHYNALRGNARRRGIEFTLTFEQFRAIWQQHPEKWAAKRRWGSECPWQMDRKDARYGYIDGNIQIITKRKNIMKYWNHDRYVVEAYYTRPETGRDKAPF